MIYRKVRSVRLLEKGKSMDCHRLYLSIASFAALVTMNVGGQALGADEGGNSPQRSFEAVARGAPGDNQGKVQIGNFAWHQGSARTPQSITHDPVADIWRFEVRSGENEVPADQQSAETRVKDRSELWMLGNTPSSFRQGACVSYDLYLESVPFKQGGWTVLGQWHAVEDPGDVHLSPVLAAEYDNGTLKIVTRSDFSPKQSLPNKLVIIAYQDSRYPMRQWVRWKYSAVFSTDKPTGSLYVWRDGKQIIAKNDIAMGYNDKVLPRFQFGIYRGGSITGDAVVYYRNMHIEDGACSRAGG
jgi:hypothetical protein